MEMENVNKSQTDILKLHDDVLLEIFGYLHGNKDKRKSDIVNATLVCKKWNRLITQEPRLMDKLKLNVDVHELLADNFIRQGFKLTRPYRHAIIGFTIDIIDRSEQKKMRKVNEIFNQISSLGSLTTINLYRMKLTPKLIEFLSHFKFLRVLVVEYCVYNIDSDDYDDELDGVQKFNFDSLRQLKFDGGEAMQQAQVLQHFKCKSLDIFVMEQSYFAHTDAVYVIQFLNELERCDEIVVDVDKWRNFGNDTLRLKFTWSKLILTYSPADLRHEIPFIEALCKASKPNAESEITFKDMRDREANLWPAVLNNCKGIIKSLTLLNSYVPSNLEHLRLLPELRKLKVDGKTIEQENFVRLTEKLTGVSHLEFHRCKEQKIKLSPESALQLQPFFDQIVELTLRDNYLRHEFEFANRNELVSFLDTECKNLRTLNVINLECDPSLYNDHYDEKFFNFCTQNKNLNHLNVEVDPLSFYSTNSQLGALYEKLHGSSSIQTCNILIKDYDPPTPTNNSWREAEFDEVQLFGRVLTDDENRFFI